MSDPFLAEVRIFGCNFAPRGWATCDGQLMPISQNTALFSLLGVNFG
ncbi:MAG: phage tail protein, partial [Burkholderiales bacterium PBB5]